jgi:hypothetical protein
MLSGIPLEGQPMLIDEMNRSRETARRRASKAWGDLRGKPPFAKRVTEHPKPF